MDQAGGGGGPDTPTRGLSLPRGDSDSNSMMQMLQQLLELQRRNEARFETLERDLVTRARKDTATGLSPIKEETPAKDNASRSPNVGRGGVDDSMFNDVDISSFPDLQPRLLAKQVDMMDNNDLNERMERARQDRMDDVAALNARKAKERRRSSGFALSWGDIGGNDKDENTFNGPPPSSSLSQFAILGEKMESRSADNVTVIRTISPFPKDSYLGRINFFALRKWLKDIREYRVQSKESVVLREVITEEVQTLVAQYLSGNYHKIAAGARARLVTVADVQDKISDKWLLLALSKLLTPHDDQQFYNIFNKALTTYSSKYDVEHIRNQVRVNIMAVENMQSLFFRYHIYFLEFYNMMYNVCAGDDRCDLSLVIPPLWHGAVKENLYNLYVDHCPFPSYYKLLMSFDNRLLDFVGGPLKKKETDICALLDTVTAALNLMVDQITASSKAINVITNTMKQVVSDDNKKPGSVADTKLREVVYEAQKSRSFNGKWKKKDLHTLLMAVREQLQEEGLGDDLEMDDGIFAMMSGVSTNDNSSMACNGMLYHGVCSKPGCSFNHSRPFLEKHAKRAILSMARHYGPIGLWQELQDKMVFKDVELLAPSQKIMQRPTEKTLYTQTAKPKTFNSMQEDAMLSLENYTSSMMGGDVPLGAALEDSYELYQADDSRNDVHIDSR